MDSLVLKRDVSLCSQGTDVLLGERIVCLRDDRPPDQEGEGPFSEVGAGAGAAAEIALRGVLRVTPVILVICVDCPVTIASVDNVLRDL
jgi:hypothetical protein